MLKAGAKKRAWSIFTVLVTHWSWLGEGTRCVSRRRERNRYWERAL